MPAVDFMNHPQDLKVALLGSLGLSTEYIAAVTGFTPGQVLYRLGRAHVKRAEYRSGKSPIARLVLARSMGVVKERVGKELAGSLYPKRAQLPESR